MYIDVHTDEPTHQKTISGHIRYFTIKPRALQYVTGHTTRKRCLILRRQGS